MKVALTIGKNLELERELSPNQMVTLLELMDMAEDDEVSSPLTFISNFPKIEREA